MQFGAEVIYCELLFGVLFLLFFSIRACLPTIRILNICHFSTKNIRDIASISVYLAARPAILHPPTQFCHSFHPLLLVPCLIHVVTVSNPLLLLSNHTLHVLVEMQIQFSSVLNYPVKIFRVVFTHLFQRTFPLRTN